MTQTQKTMNSKIWETKSGEEIPINKLKDDHLLNIKKFIERRAREGVEVYYDYGYDGDDNFKTGEIGVLYGAEAKRKMDYGDILKEIKKRKLL